MEFKNIDSVYYRFIIIDFLSGKSTHCNVVCEADTNQILYAILLKKQILIELIYIMNEYYGETGFADQALTQQFISEYVIQNLNLLNLNKIIKVGIPIESYLKISVTKKMNTHYTCRYINKECYYYIYEIKDKYKHILLKVDKINIVVIRS